MGVLTPISRSCGGPISLDYAARIQSNRFRECPLRSYFFCRSMRRAPMKMNAATPIVSTVPRITATLNSIVFGFLIQVEGLLAWIIHDFTGEKRKDALKGLMNTGFLANPAFSFGASQR
jgi:hypothetical protein